MKLSECVLVLDGEMLVDSSAGDFDIKVACGADLMSDVMAFACTSNELMLTGLVNPQAIRTAEMLDVKVIVFVRGKRPDEPMLDLARERGIAVISTPLPMFSACGLLYQNGVRGRGQDSWKQSD